MCTSIRFADKSGNLYLARNLDWNTRYGEQVVYTPEGYELGLSFADNAPARYNVLGMAVAAGNYPLYFDCGNDAGLAVAGLNHPGNTVYTPEPVEGKMNIAAYEFPLWIAARFATVEEARAALADVNIVAKPFAPGQFVSKLHWIIGDATGSIVVEQLEDGLHVFDNPVDTLSNQPEFPWHLTNLRNFITVSNEFGLPAKWRDADLAPFGAGAGSRGLPGDSYSTSRFVRAAFHNANYPEKETEAQSVSRAFHILSSVAMIEGASKMGNGEFERTLYTGCFSAASNSYYYSTYDQPALVCISMDDMRARMTDNQHIVIE